MSEETKQQVNTAEKSSNEKPSGENVMSASEKAIATFNKVIQSVKDNNGAIEVSDIFTLRDIMEGSFNAAAATQAELNAAKEREIEMAEKHLNLQERLGKALSSAALMQANNPEEPKKKPSLDYKAINESAREERFGGIKLESWL